MFDKKFNIFRYLVIFIGIISLALICFLDKKIKNDSIKITHDTVIDASKKYVNDNKDYFNDIKKEKIEYRIKTSDLVNKKYMSFDENFEGFVKINDNSYEFINENNLLIDKLLENNNLSSNNNNEGMPFDINYYYRDEPNNYIKQNDELYRIIGITNSNYLKVIKIDSEEIDGYGTDGNINYFNSKNDDIVNGIFYVGYVRSETTDLSQIIKNEKRNNNYTKTVPKYYGSYSYSNVSDIINSSNDCKFDNILNINSENCNSYLIELLKDSYLSNTLENDKVYLIDENGFMNSSDKLDNIKIHKVIYINSVSKYINGDGSFDNPYIFE